MEDAPDPLASRVEWIDHTGDMAFRVRARSWVDLLAAATGALGGVLLEGGEVETLEARDVDVAGEDREDVLVAWLNEALLLFEGEGLVPRTATFESAGRTGARGTLFARRLGPGVAPDRVVKAVTYHGLAIVEGDGGRPWEATVVLDL